MVLLALGSVADWNALTAAQQAMFAARYNNLFAVWQFLVTIDNPLPDNYRLVYIGSVVEDDDWVFAAFNMVTGINQYIEVTALNMTTIKPEINTRMVLVFCNFGADVGGNLIMHDIFYRIGNSGAGVTYAIRPYGGAGCDTVNFTFYNLIMQSFVAIGIGLQRIFFELDNASYGHRVNLKMYNIKMGHPWMGIRFGYPASIAGWIPRTIIENCSMDMRLSGHQGIGTITEAVNRSWQYTLKNVVAFGSSIGINSGDFVPNPNAPMPPVNNCADGDGSIAANIAGAVDCIGNITPANEFQSLVYANDDYLKLIEGTRTWV